MTSSWSSLYLQTLVVWYFAPLSLLSFSCYTKHTMHISDAELAPHTGSNVPYSRTLSNAPHSMHTLRSPSQGSSISYTSTANLVPHAQRSRKKLSWPSWSCCRRKHKIGDSEKNGGSPQSHRANERNFTLLQGWKVIFLGSCTSNAHFVFELMLSSYKQG